MLTIKALSWKKVPGGVSHWRAEVKVNYVTHQEILEIHIWRLFPFTSPLLPADNSSGMRLVQEARPRC